MKGETPAMQLFLLRHGIAEEKAASARDADRALSHEGRRKLRHVLEAAAAAGLQPSLILTSPFKRAIETAEIARQILGYTDEPLRTTSLTPNSPPEEVWEEVRIHRGESSLLLVGHNPLFAELAAYLLGCKDLQIEVTQGALLRIDVDNFAAQPRGTLCWHLTSTLVAERA